FMAREQRQVSIGVYNESSAGMLGGSEYYCSVLAEGLCGDNVVELVHHHEGLDRGLLESFTGLDLRRVSLRFERRIAPAATRSDKPWQIWRDSRAWQAHLSKGYDLFINVAHWMPPFCHASRGVLVCLFPLFNPLASWPFNEPASPLDVRRRLRNSYYG